MDALFRSWSSIATYRAQPHRVSKLGAYVHSFRLPRSSQSRVTFLPMPQVIPNWPTC